MRQALTQLGNPTWAWLSVLVAAPGLMFPGQVPAVAPITTALIVLPALAALLTRQTVWPASPLTLPATGVLAMGTLGLAVSSYPDVSWPKFAGLVLGWLALRALLLSVTTVTRLRLAVWLFLLVGLVFTVAGFEGTALSTKLLPAWLIAPFPQRIRNLPGTDGSVNPNALGATTLFFLPLVVSLLLASTRVLLDKPDQHAQRRRDSQRSLGRLFAAVAARCALTLVGAALLGVLTLSQSRAAWTAAAGALATLAIARFRRGLWLVGMVVLAVVATLYFVPDRGALEEFQKKFARGVTDNKDLTSGLNVRRDLWRLGLDAVAEHPWTGVGLNAFRRYGPDAYGQQWLKSAGDVAHVHNIFLQTALDIGIPGLIAYLWLLTAATIQAWRARAGPPSFGRAAALGLFCGILGIHLFGLVDAIALGAKVGLFFWMALGLLGAWDRLSRQAETTGASGAPC